MIWRREKKPKNDILDNTHLKCQLFLVFSVLAEKYHDKGSSVYDNPFYGFAWNTGIYIYAHSHNFLTSRVGTKLIKV